MCGIRWCLATWRKQVLVCESWAAGSEVTRDNGYGNTFNNRKESFLLLLPLFFPVQPMEPNKEGSASEEGLWAHHTLRPLLRASLLQVSLFRIIFPTIAALLVRILTLLRLGCVTSDKFLNLSGLVFFLYKMELMTSNTCFQGLCGLKK